MNRREFLKRIGIGTAVIKSVQVIEKTEAKPIYEKKKPTQKVQNTKTKTSLKANSCTLIIDGKDLSSKCLGIEFFIEKETGWSQIEMNNPQLDITLSGVDYNIMYNNTEKLFPICLILHRFNIKYEFEAFCAKWNLEITSKISKTNTHMKFVIAGPITKSVPPPIPSPKIKNV